MIETKGGQIAKRGDSRLTYFAEHKFRDLIAFLTLARTKELIEKRKGSDTLDLVEDLIKIGLLAGYNGKVTTGTVHFCESQSLPNVLANQVVYFNKFPNLLRDIHFSLRSVGPEKEAKIKKIIDKTIKDLNAVGSDRDGDTGITLGIYYGLTEK